VRILLKRSSLTSHTEHQSLARFKKTHVAIGLLRGEEPDRKPEADIGFWIVAFFAIAATGCAVLIAPVLWTAMMEIARPPELTFRKSESLNESASRLTCYDSVGLHTYGHTTRNRQPAGALGR
jgi:hypothetical protein